MSGNPPKCDVCGQLIWGKPRQFLLSSSPAMVGHRIEVCKECGKKLDFASSIFRRTAVEKNQKGE